MASSPNSTASLLQTAMAYFEESRPLLPMYLHIILSTLFPIYTGAHASLSRPSSAAKPLRKRREDTGGEDDEEEEEDEEKVQRMEGMTASDAITMPLIAGTILAGLYFVITRYGAEMINLVMGWYFAAIGVFSVAKLLNDGIVLLAGVVFPDFYYDKGRVWKVDNTGERKTVTLGGDQEKHERQSPLAGVFGRLPLPRVVLNGIWMAREKSRQRYVVKGFFEGVFDFKVVMTRLNFFSAGLGVATIAYSVLVSTPWWLTNLQGFAVCYGALQLMSPTSFATGSLILTGLFFYDIWAVFFTPLMITVAKNLDVPIKLVFPRPDEPSQVPDEPPAKTYSMLGLGDIVLPGIMIALALRFDLYMFYLKKQKKIAVQDDDKGKASIEKSPYISVSRRWGEKMWTIGAARSLLPANLSGEFPKTYFIASLIGYVVGLVTTLAVMAVWQHGQPALLYLVPGVLISLWTTGLVRGELKQMWDYTEEMTAEQIDEQESSPNVDIKKINNDKSESESTSVSDWLWRKCFGSSSSQTSKTEQKSQEKVATTAQEPNSNDKDKKTSDEEPAFYLLIQREAAYKANKLSKTNVSPSDQASKQSG